MRMGTRGKVLSRIKYPKLLLLVLSYGIAFVIFAEKSYAPLHDTLVFLGLLRNLFGRVPLCLRVHSCARSCNIADPCKGAKLVSSRINRRPWRFTR